MPARLRPSVRMAYEFLPLIHRVHSAYGLSPAKVSEKQCCEGHCYSTSSLCVHLHLTFRNTVCLGLLAKQEDPGKLDYLLPEIQ